MTRSSLEFFECLSIQSSDERIKFSMVIHERETSVQIGEGLICALCEAVILEARFNRFSSRNYRWEDSSSILAQTWP